MKIKILNDVPNYGTVLKLQLVMHNMYAEIRSGHRK